MEKIKKQIERLLPQMTRIIVSNRLDKTYQYRKVEVTWTTVRGKELCQIAAYTEKQVFQENVDVEELAGKLLVHFPEHLCQMNIFTEEKEYSFKMTKKGKLLTNATRLPAKQSGTSKLAKTSGSDVADLADKMNSHAVLSSFFAIADILCFGCFVFPLICPLFSYGLPHDRGNPF